MTQETDLSFSRCPRPECSVISPPSGAGWTRQAVGLFLSVFPFFGCRPEKEDTALGAQALGLSAWNRNMLYKFAANISESKDWCTFLEINSSGQTLTWIARFYGKGSEFLVDGQPDFAKTSLDELHVNGKPMPAETASDPSVYPLLKYRIPVMPGQSCSFGCGPVMR